VNYFFTAVDKIVELKNRPKKEQANLQKEEIDKLDKSSLKKWGTAAHIQINQLRRR